jgi:hypothetical protein
LQVYHHLAINREIQQPHPRPAEPVTSSAMDDMLSQPASGARAGGTRLLRQHQVQHDPAAMERPRTKIALARRQLQRSPAEFSSRG